MALVLGIDPGREGALAVYGPGYLDVQDMPVFDMTIGKTKRKRVDAVGVIDVIETAKMLGVELAVLEAVGGRPKQSASAGFVFGYSVGLVYMALIQARIPVETVTPQVWKRLMRVPTDVGRIMERADETFPDHRRLFRGKKDGAKDGRAEAAFLAKFGHDRLLGSVRPDAEWRLTYSKADTGA